MKCKLCNKEATYTARGKTYNRPCGLCPSHQRMIYRKKIVNNFIPITESGEVKSLEKDKESNAPFKQDPKIGTFDRYDYLSYLRK